MFYILRREFLRGKDWKIILRNLFFYRYIYIDKNFLIVEKNLINLSIINKKGMSIVFM